MNRERNVEELLADFRKCDPFGVLFIFDIEYVHFEFQCDECLVSNPPLPEESALFDESMQPNTSVSVRGGDEGTVRPGGDVLMDVTLRNEGSDPSIANVAEIIPPDGWTIERVSTKQKPYLCPWAVTEYPSPYNGTWYGSDQVWRVQSLGPGEMSTVTVTLGIPEEVEPGRYTLEVGYSNGDGATATASKEIVVENRPSTQESESSTQTETSEPEPSTTSEAATTQEEQSQEDTRPDPDSGTTGAGADGFGVVSVVVAVVVLVVGVRRLT